MEMYLIAIVLIGAIGLYIIERWSKGETIDVADAGKIGLAASALTGGIVFALDTNTASVASVVSNASEHIADASTSAASAAASAAVEIVQDMFVGKPSF
jgi:hypothetical protein